MRDHVMNIRILCVFFDTGARTRQPAMLNARKWRARWFDARLLVRYFHQVLTISSGEVVQTTSV